MTQYLTITIVLPNQEIFTEQFLQLVAKLECNIEESRMVLLGDQFTALLLTSGNWGAIAKLEANLLHLQNQSQVNVSFYRTKLASYKEKLLPYLVQIIALDAPGLLYEISHFFTTQKIIINDLQINPFQAIHSGTKMASLLISINIPIHINLSDLRERFLLMCDELNIDGIIEPEKR